jgi:RecA-family ATPase
MGAPFDVEAYRAAPRDLSGGRFENEFSGARQYPPADADKIVRECANIRAAVTNQKQVAEPWWHSVIGVSKFCDGPDNVAHRWSRQYPDYDPGETQTKLDNWRGTGATKCSTLADHNPQACASCPHRGKIKSPIVLGYPESNQVATLESGGTVVKEPSLCLEAGLLVLSAFPPPKRLWAIDKLMALGKYAILAGLGGVSKTMLAIVWAIHIVLGKSWGGLGVSEGAVMMLLGEEDREEVIARFGAICQKMLDEDRQKVMCRALVFPWAGKDMRVTMQRDGNPMETYLPAEIIKTAQAHAERCGVPVRLIVIDHARLIIGGDPNDAQHVTEVTRVLTKIADATGAAVVLIAHSPKTAIGKGKKGESADAADIAGSIAWVDNSRAALVLTTMRDDEAKKLAIDKEDRHQYAKLQLVKANYAPTGWECWLRRMTVPDFGVAIPQVVTLNPPTKVSADIGLESRVVELLTRLPGQLTINKIRTNYAGKTRHLAAAEADVELALSKLIDAGKIRQRKPTDDEKDRFGLTRARLILEVQT